MRTAIFLGEAAGSEGLARRLWRDRRGLAALEFALCLPPLLLLLAGIMSYGGYFWIAHSVQQSANDAARAAIGGLTQAERQTLAQAAFDASIADAALEPGLAAMTLSDAGQTLSVAVTYDAAQSAAFVLRSIVPMPSTHIRRSAAIQRGGY